jgi:hypothetical protein
VKPPLAPPSALPKVPVMMSTPACRRAAAVLVRAAAGGAHEAGGMAFVDASSAPCASHSARITSSCAMVPSIENTPSVKTSLMRAPGAASLQAALQVGHVVVRVAPALRLAQADAVDDGGVVQRVADDHVGLAEQRLEQAAVGVEGGGVEDGVLGAEEARQALLQLLCRSCVPQMKRTELRPKPWLRSASCAASITPGGRPGPGSCWRTG